MLPSILAEAAKVALPTISAPWSETAGSELMQGLLLILPGLVTVAIIQSLTVKQKLEPLERVIQALLYTFVNHVTWQTFLSIINIGLLVFTWGHHWWEPTAKAQLVCLGGSAVAWGLIATWVINVGWLHDKLRDLKWLRERLAKLPVPKFLRLTGIWPATSFGLTKRSSRPSEWYDAFYEGTTPFVVIHLKDARRLYGWVKFYPDLPTEGHLLLCDAEWLPNELPKEVEPVPPPIPLVRILINVADVQFVEFVSILKQETSNGESTTTEQGGSQTDGQEGRGEPATGGPAASAPSPSAATPG